MSDRKQTEGTGSTSAREAGSSGAGSSVRRVMAVMSGKGGVGKSTTAALLAVEMRRLGLSVGVLDADITGPSIPRLFGLRNRVVGSEKGIEPAETTSGIKVMSVNLMLDREDQAVVWRGPLIGNVIKQFWTDVNWGSLDALIVDLPPGTADAPLTVMQSIPLNGIVLVTSPQELAGMVVRKAAGMAETMHVPIVGVVENMAYATCPQCGARLEVFGPSHLQEMTDSLSLPLLGRMPIDADLATLCDNGRIETFRSDVMASIARGVLALAPETKTKPTFA